MSSRRFQTYYVNRSEHAGPPENLRVELGQNSKDDVRTSVSRRCRAHGLLLTTAVREMTPFVVFLKVVISLFLR